MTRTTKQKPGDGTDGTRPRPQTRRTRQDQRSKTDKIARFRSDGERMLQLDAQGLGLNKPTNNNASTTVITPDFIPAPPVFLYVVRDRNLFRITSIPRKSLRKWAGKSTAPSLRFKRITLSSFMMHWLCQIPAVQKPLMGGALGRVWFEGICYRSEVSDSFQRLGRNLPSRGKQPGRGQGGRRPGEVHVNGICRNSSLSP